MPQVDRILPREASLALFEPLNDTSLTVFQFQDLQGNINNMP
jgi:hypothetical protein